MSLQPQEVPPVPDETRRIARAAFPKSNVYIRRGRPSSRLSTHCGRGWRAVSRKGYDVFISAGVGIWGWRARTSSSS
jgi:hypothetical protein